MLHAEWLKLQRFIVSRSWSLEVQDEDVGRASRQSPSPPRKKEKPLPRAGSHGATDQEDLPGGRVVSE